jgi:hypothetical protein
MLGLFAVVAVLAAWSPAPEPEVQRLLASVRLGLLLGLMFLVAFGSAFLACMHFGVGREKEVKPDIEAYVDQMLAANGTHLKMDANGD